MAALLDAGADPLFPTLYDLELEDFALGEFGRRPAGTTPQALARFRTKLPTGAGSTAGGHNRITAMLVAAGRGAFSERAEAKRRGDAAAGEGNSSRSVRRRTSTPRTPR